MLYWTNFYHKQINFLEKTEQTQKANFIFNEGELRWGAFDKYSFTEGELRKAIDCLNGLQLFQI